MLEIEALTRRLEAERKATKASIDARIAAGDVEFIRRVGPPTDVYFMYDADGELLYVGISLCVPVRLEQHRRDKSWWQEVVRIEIEHHTHRRAALFSEKMAIRMRSPKYNVNGQLGGSRYGGH